MSLPTKNPAVAIVGAGPSGLKAAADLAAKLKGDVLVLDRESAPGGIPRHCFHPGYGIRDLRRFISGPRYARVLADRASAAGADICTNAMVTGWTPEGALEVASPQGRFQVAAQATILATGARERPRAARRIPGDRPAGVLTTGHLQNLVHLHHQKVGNRAVIVGSELVSWSAALTLRHAGCTTVLMTTQYPAPDVYRLFSTVGSLYFGTKVATRTRVVRVIGRERVSGVEIEDTITGNRRVVECDTVVFTGDWIPDHELARTAGITLDPHTLGPAVDTRLRTERDAVFAIGNLVHPVDTADVAALDGAHVAPQVLDYLDRRHPRPQTVELQPGDGFSWVSPSRFQPGDVAPARRLLLLWPDQGHNRPTVIATQQGREIGRLTTWWPSAPGRVFRVGYSLLDNAQATHGPVTIQIRRR
ncbi:MAG: NAD(P)/FAD-dependent oxidoreductase [Arachnia sp.]